MDGYPTFRNLTLQSWERCVIVHHVSPLADKEELEAYFSKFGEIERIRFIHNPENGCFMMKALIQMKSARSAAAIIDMIHHRYSTDAIPSPETAIDEFVTTVKYRGRVKIYPNGLFNLYLMLEVPWNQDFEDDRTLMGLYLTRKLVRAYRGLVFTAIRLETDANNNYTGLAIISFLNKCDEEIVLKITEQQLKVRGRWVDNEADTDKIDTSDDEIAEGASEKVEGDEDGDDQDVECDEEGSDNLDEDW